MKHAKLVCALCWLICLSTAGSLRGASVSVPGTLPGQGDWVLGFEINQVSDRVFSKRSKIESDQYVGRIEYGLLDRLSVFGKVGTANLQFDNAAVSIPGVKSNHDDKMAFGGGLRGILYEDMAIGLKAGVGGQYFSFNPGRVDAYPRGYTQDATWDELQATAFFSLTQEMYKYARLIEPFALTSASLCAGISYSTVDIDWETDGSSGTLEADDNVGFIAGFDLVFNELYTLSLEARFGAEDAYTLGFSVRF